MEELGEQKDKAVLSNVEAELYIREKVGATEEWKPVKFDENGKINKILI